MAIKLSSKTRGFILASVLSSLMYVQMTLSCMVTFCVLTRLAVCSVYIMPIEKQTYQIENIRLTE